MWASLVAGGGKLLAGLMGLVGDLFRYIAVFFAFRLGVRKERQDQAERTAEVKEKQLEIAARGPEHRADLLERMRKRGL